jgi:hypothetical protein
MPLPVLIALTGVFSYTTIVRTKIAKGNGLGLDFSEFRPYNSGMKTPRMGRPPKGDEPLSERLELRITPSERRAYEQAAQDADMERSDWIRVILNKAAKNALKRPRQTP